MTESKQEHLQKVKELIKLGKALSERYQKVENEVFEILNQMGVAIDALTEAPNADNLWDAIMCYMTYDEYNLSDLMKEIEKAMPEEE